MPISIDQAEYAGRETLKKGFRISDRIFPSLFLYPGVIFVAILVIYPFIFFLITTFQYYYLPRPMMKRWIGFTNYIDIFNDPLFWNSVSVTIKYLIIAVGAEMVLGFFIALLLHGNLRFRSLWRTAMLIPMIIAPVVVGVIWKNMFNGELGVIPYLLGQLGFHSQYLGGTTSALWCLLVAEIWEWTPFVALICLAGLSALPVEPFEAAAVDGAKPWQVLVRITIPLMRPYLVIAFILRFIMAYKVFDPIFIMTQGGPGSSTQIISMRVYETAFQKFHIGQGSALALLVLIFAIIVAQIFIRKVLLTKPEGGNA